MLFILKADFKIIRINTWAKVLSALILVLAVPDTGRLKAAPSGKGVVTASKLNVRKSPDRAASVVLVLEQGEQVSVLEAQGGVGGWLKVSYHQEKGYVRNRPRYIRLYPSEDPSANAAEPAGTDAPKQAQPSAAESKPLARQKAIEKEIEQETMRMASFSEKEMEILDGLNEIDFALNKARITSQGLRRESQALARKISSIQTRITTLSGTMDKNQAYAGQRLAALYRMHMMGTLEMAGPPASLFDFFVKQTALKKVVASDFEFLNAQALALKELNRLKQDLDLQVASRNTLEEELALQIRIREKESRKKSAILEEIRQKKKLTQAAIEALKQSARDLDQTIESMGLHGSPALDNTPFVRYKGSLDPPVQGTIVSSFGKTRKGAYNSFTFQSGIDIKVERGEPVRSVFKGEIMFAQWLKGYGNLVIINHGDNYYTLYAHVEEIFKKKGEQVGTGEVIATAGDSGSIKGLCLHFEVRHHGKPINPIKWLKKGA